jgi:hypothetical protein
MDEAAIFTIDAWCQRMLREHAFDSGSLFDEELVSDERALFEDAAHDYWRQHVYPLNAAALGALLGVLARRRRAESSRCATWCGAPLLGDAGRAAGGADRARERAASGRTGAPERKAGERAARWSAGSRPARCERAEVLQRQQDARRLAGRNGSRPCAPGRRPGAGDAGPVRHGLAPPDAGRHHRRLQQGLQRRSAGLLRCIPPRCGRRWRSSRSRTRCCATRPATSRAAWRN